MEMCYHCEENESCEDGPLCEDCRAGMWLDQRTHHEDEPIERGMLEDSHPDRTTEDITRANGGNV